MVDRSTVTMRRINCAFPDWTGIKSVNDSKYKWLLPWKHQCFRHPPLGILNLLSFLYHIQPRSLVMILTGNSVSGQSASFRAKSDAAAQRRRKTWIWCWNRGFTVECIYLCSIMYGWRFTDRWICSQQEGGVQDWDWSLPTSAEPTRPECLTRRNKRIPGLT